MQSCYFHRLESCLSGLKSVELTEAFVVQQTKCSCFCSLPTLTMQAVMRADTMILCGSDCIVSHGRTCSQIACWQRTWHSARSCSRLAICNDFQDRLCFQFVPQSMGVRAFRFRINTTGIIHLFVFLPICVQSSSKDRKTKMMLAHDLQMCSSTSVIESMS